MESGPPRSPTWLVLLSVSLGLCLRRVGLLVAPFHAHCTLVDMPLSSPLRTSRQELFDFPERAGQASLCLKDAGKPSLPSMRLFPPPPTSP